MFIIIIIIIKQFCVSNTYWAHGNEFSKSPSGLDIFTQQAIFLQVYLLMLVNNKIL
jgi:hypothetical protein